MGGDPQCGDHDAPVLCKWWCVDRYSRRTVLSTFRGKLFTEIFPGRSTVPKTLIFAKDDSHADDIVQMIRDVFAKGNEFATKITYRTATANPKTY